MTRGALEIMFALRCGLPLRPERGAMYELRDKLCDLLAGSPALTDEEVAILPADHSIVHGWVRKLDAELDPPHIQKGIDLPSHLDLVSVDLHEIRRLSENLSKARSEIEDDNTPSPKG